MSIWQTINADPRWRNLYWGIFLAGLIWTIILWAQSPGMPFDDEVAHVVLAHNAWRDVGSLLLVWGRVVNTMIYMAPSLLGLMGARLASVVMACLIVYLATGVAARTRVRRLYLIPLFLWLQPWHLALSYTANTMIPFSLFMILGAYLWLDEKSEWASFAFGLLPLVRHEGIVLTGLWCLFALFKRQWRVALVCWLPMALYNVAYLVLLQPSLDGLPIAIYFLPTLTDFYGSGTWFHYVPRVIAGMGVPVFVWFVHGAIVTRDFYKTGLVGLFYLAYFMIHTIIYRFGLYASGGYGLFLFPLAPVLAIFAAKGAEYMLEMVFAYARQRSRLVWFLAVGALALIVVVPVLGFALQVSPRPLADLKLALSEAATWMRQHDIMPERVFTVHVWFYYEYLYDTHWTVGDWLVSRDLDALPLGTVAVWDDHYSERLRLSIDYLSSPENGWVRLVEFGDHVVVFRKSF